MRRSGPIKRLGQHADVRGIARIWRLIRADQVEKSCEAPRDIQEGGREKDPRSASRASASQRKVVPQGQMLFNLNPALS